MDLDTGIKRTAESNQYGAYTVPLLDPGHYQLFIAKEGFRSVSRTGITLHVNDSARIDFTLEVGAVTDSIRVEATAPLLHSSEAGHGAVIDNAKMVTLPLNGRNLFQLSALIPGVQPGAGFYAGPGQYSSLTVNRMNNIVVNGGAGFTTEVLLDGASDISAGQGTVAFTPSVDTIAEFRVQTTNYSAEFGRSGGGVVNIATKSGTNGLHGTAYEFLRNKVLDANSFFNNRAGIDRQPFTFNQFGVTAGGPVILPKLYNGRNRTFFFFGYEGERMRQARNFIGTVPTEPQKQGNFSETRNSAGALIAIYNPFTSRRVNGGFVRDPIPGNTIPSSLLDPVALKAAAFYPKANQPGLAFSGANNFIANGPDLLDLDIVQWRVDHSFSDRNRGFLRVARSVMEKEGPNFFGTLATTNELGPNVNTDWHATASDTHTFGPATVLEVRAGYARNLEDRMPRSLGFDLTSLGLPEALNRQVRLRFFPTFRISGMSQLGPCTCSPFKVGNDTYSFAASLTLIRGRHNLKVGTDLRAIRHNTPPFGGMSGSFSFTQGFTQGPDPLRSTATAGFGYASFLLGAGGGSVPVPSSISYQNLYYAGFVQDDIQVTRKLTVNLGLRYDYETPRTERFNRMAFFNPTAPSPIAAQVNMPKLVGGLQFVGVDGNPRGWTEPDRNNLGPRFGFAYQAFPKTVLRGGYGLTYLPNGTSFNAYGAGTQGFSATTTLVSTVDGVTPETLLRNAFADGLIEPPGSSLGLLTLLGQGIAGNLRGLRVGYIQQWSFDLQRELPGQALVQAGYVGTRGIGLPMSFQLNQLPDQHLALGTQLLNLVPNPFFEVVSSGVLSRPTVQYGQLLRPFPHFQGVSFSDREAGASTYHGFQLRVEKRFGAGLSLLAAYTNSKLISDTDTRKGWLGDPTGNVQNSNNRRLERSVAPQDVSQRLVISYIYALPIGKGKRWTAGRLGLLVGGWSLTGVTILQSGRPLTLTTTANSTNSFGGGSRPNNNGTSAYLQASERTLERWFNPGVFSQPEPFTFGNTGRTLPDVRDWGMIDFDFSTHKTFDLKERMQLQFRAEFFNLFNRPQFGRPGMALGNSQFGVISTQANIPRQVQFGLKLIF